MGNDNWYILFVVAGREEAIAKEIERRFRKENFKPFVPLRDTIRKEHGVTKHIKEKMFPGYLFIEAAMKQDEFLEATQNFVSATYGAIRVLTYGDGSAALRNEDKHFIHYLIGNERCMQMSTAIKEGSKITVLYGPLKGIESTIKKVNSHKRTAWIEVEFLGAMRQVAVGLEFIRGVNE
jgi:transcriptional antiterminator NusG